MAKYILFLLFLVSLGACGFSDSAVNEPVPVPLKIKLPFPAGSTYEVIQGNHGDFTHVGFNEYAWDFAMPQGSIVCASADGRIVRVKQNSDAGGASQEYLNQGNTVVIDHGDGYFTQYLHLKKDSVRLKEGDRVRGGHAIALSGNTGFSTMPHLHFQVQDAMGRALPAKFLDVEQAGGVPAENSIVTSGNNGQGVSAYAGESQLPSELFLKNGIRLNPDNLPGVLWKKGKRYSFRGQLLNSTEKQIAFFFMGPEGGTPIYSGFARVDDDDSFQFDFDWDLLRPGIRQRPEAIEPISFSIAPVKSDGSFWSDVSLPISIR